MKQSRHSLATLTFLILMSLSSQARSEPIAPIARRLPPVGMELEEKVEKELTSKLGTLESKFAEVKEHRLAADIEVYLKAIRLALRHQEFYKKQDVDKAHELLDIANKRIAELKQSKSPWTEARGLVVRGYESSVDGSAQPYGLVIPEQLDLSKPAPLYVWLHGRGDKNTDLAFIHQRHQSAGQITPDDAIVLHPWGRHCIGYKSAGEIDVLEGVEQVSSQYKIDPQRIVLMGFSMGGAGAWHVGAHYADRWVAMSPGAGFAETRLYANVDPAQTPSYEQELWGMYDVPGYVRNLFNLPVIAYSGEKDKQIQAAQVMEEAFAAEGQKLDHRIGPGMGHKYHPDTLASILKNLKDARERGLNLSPKKVSLQTQTLRYHKMFWVDVQGLEKHWKDSRVDAEHAGNAFRVTTKNVTALTLSPNNLPDNVKVEIDGQTIAAKAKDNAVSFVKQNGQWSVGEPKPFAKRPHLQGPIDDAFLDPFLVVIPSGKSQHEKFQQWMEFELEHFLDRWQALYRAEPRVKRDVDVTQDDMQKYHLIVWGDPHSNSVLKELASNLPTQWKSDKITAKPNSTSYSADHHALLMIYPNPRALSRYVVLNSGPTFREGHDRTNSLQNPKLPDWAVIDLNQPPNEYTPGKVVNAQFFDEDWQLINW